MVHTYQISGMTCTNCEAKVKSALLQIDNVEAAEVSKSTGSATITMRKHVGLSELQKALGDKYRISALQHNETVEQTKSLISVYKPVLLLFFYITAATVLIQLTGERFDYMQWMRHFMAGFFLTFSFFKMLNLKGFADSYVMYDVLAKRIPAWAYVYAFIELALGVAYLINFNPIITNSVTALVMTISIIGVLQTVLNKQKIQCACLGAVFNLPMSMITILEDSLMILMSIAMLFML